MLSNSKYAESDYYLALSAGWLLGSLRILLKSVYFVLLKGCLKMY